jgi:hypothetical protein
MGFATGPLAHQDCLRGFERDLGLGGFQATE